MLAELQQLILHGTKARLVSTDVGPAIVISIPPDFIDLTRKLKADVGEARGYSLGGYGYGYGHGCNNLFRMGQRLALY